MVILFCVVVVVPGKSVDSLSMVECDRNNNALLGKYNERNGSIQNKKCRSIFIFFHTRLGWCVHSNQYLYFFSFLFFCLIGRTSYENWSRRNHNWTSLSKRPKVLRMEHRPPASNNYRHKVNTNISLFF